MIELQQDALKQFEASNNVPTPENWLDLILKNLNAYYSIGHFPVAVAVERINSTKSVFIVFRGGYLLIPEEFEFWQGNDIRLHDRLRFRRPLANEKLDTSMIIQGEKGWIIERLAP